MFSPGNIVRYHQRDWMVIPSAEEDVLRLKPVGGSDLEIAGIYIPFYRADADRHRLVSLIDSPRDDLYPGEVPGVKPDDLGDFHTARLLFDASRLSFRNVSGPFRCMGKLSFRPRSYQVVPLVMALQLEPVRMLIADDVGIGKTIEALIVLKEMMERGDVERFAVVCPPHLCEQWQQEINDKLDIQAEIIRSSTAAALDRRLPDDRSVFYHMPYQVISIDYIKGEKHKPKFLNDLPDLVIVDEVHSCALPSGAKSKAQQQRYHLIHDISRRPRQHLLLLTATPHSGKNDEFQSLIGLLDPEFEKYDIGKIDKRQREKMARHFIQRKRENIRRWAGQDTHFPERDSTEVPYRLSPEYQRLYEKVVEFARGMAGGSAEGPQRRVRYWAALALLRGVMSSPAAGVEMLRNRKQKHMEALDEVPEMQNPLFERDEGEADVTPQEWLDFAGLEVGEIRYITGLSDELDQLRGMEKDLKAQRTVDILKRWLQEGFYPIVFCRYIATARYIGEVLKKALPDKYTVEVITSDDPDEKRRADVEALGRKPHRVLIATDCLSEGINLQEYFTAVLHYDLPWNPNRLEQREGRVDRFGQHASVVKTCLLWGEDNKIDAIVLRILIKKVREIQKSIGVSLPLGEENLSIMEAVFREVLDDKEKVTPGRQLSLFAEEEISRELEAAREKAVQLRSIFAHSSVSQEDVEAQLKEVDEAIGDVVSVRDFVCGALEHLGVQCDFDGYGYAFNPINMPVHLQAFFPLKGKALISFESPTPRGYRYIGRNHRFTEMLCQFMLALAFEQPDGYHRVARAAVVRSKEAPIKTTLVQFRVRNVIREAGSRRDVIAEEMYLWGYEGSSRDGRKLGYSEARKLLREARASGNLTAEFQASRIEHELQLFDVLQPDFLSLAEQRAEQLVEAHGRFRNLVGGRRFEKVQPVLPPDVIGLYVLLPHTSDL